MIYEDSKTGVKKFIKDMYNPKFFTPDIIEPDPNVNFVWIGIDTKNKKVGIMYLKDNDCESIPYRSNNWEDYLA